MKNINKNLLLIIGLLFSYNLGTTEVNASTEVNETQTYDYEQTFDGLSALPSGWYLPTNNPTGCSVYVQNDALYIDSLQVITPAAVYFAPSFGSDYIIEADFTVEQLLNNGRWFGTCFRVQDTAGWYKASVGFGSSYAINRYSKTNISGGAYTEYISGSFIYPPEMNKTYTIKVTCFGNKVSYELDGEYVTHGTLPSEFLTGNVGVCCSGAKVKIDNFRLTKATKAGLEVTNEVAKVHIPETGIVNPPAVISPYQENCETLPAISVFYLDDNKNILNESKEIIGNISQEKQLLNNKSIPAFYVENETQANNLIEYIKNNHILDAFVITNPSNSNLIKTIKETCYYIRGIVDYSNDYSLIKENKKAVLMKLNSLGANVVLLPKEANKDDVFYFQKRMMSVWGKATNTLDIYSLLFDGVNGIIYQSSDELYNIYKSFTSPTVIREPIVMAHRGVSTLYPQNTLNGYKLAYEMGAHAIEIDVNITSDNEIVMFHDTTLDALTTGTGKISEKTLAELNNIKVDVFASSGILERIPRLEEVFAYFEGKDIVFMLDMKAEDYCIPIVKALIYKYNMHDNCLIMDSSQNTLRLTTEAMPEVISCRGGFNNVIGSLEHDKSIEAAIKTLAPYSLQPFPYWYNTDGTWSYLYEMSTRGWLTFASTTNGQVNVDERSISLYGATGILSDDFQLSRDYIFAVEGKDIEVDVNQEFKLECLVEGYDGKFMENCKFALLTEGTYVTLENGYKFETAGQYVVIPYYEVTLHRENCRDVHYDVYGDPLTITVK